MFSKWIAYSYYSEDMDIVGIIESFGGLSLSEGEKKLMKLLTQVVNIKLVHMYGHI